MRLSAMLAAITASFAVIVAVVVACITVEDTVMGADVVMGAVAVIGGGGNAADVIVLVDEVDDTADVALARSSADAPEIDGVVHITGGGVLTPGMRLSVEITGSDDYDLEARLPAAAGQSAP